ncbi:SAVED domain-containing protein [Corallococcus macrosporus]|uniref:SMODS-associated and fused to various effectors domain-containing protein n=1 Tax=Myxococcus fulvus (strain ATCC BAA-855 / HW-1) TaxID=483219 RepID=F8CKZ6_MYXFH|nr:SAVED domain-containing protein [Corallococcus macrosporus]AEI63909.1 hypothetical protein LILAB_09990 [Corallococcus macrosporus]
MRSEDIPITPRTRALIVRYEQDREIADDAARNTLIRYGFGGDRDVASIVLHPYDPLRSVRRLPANEWSEAFHEQARFVEALRKREMDLGIDPLPVHIFGCAPLTLMLGLGALLPRRHLHVYQQAQDGTWSLGHDRATTPTPGDYFQVEGLPERRQGGKGPVVLVVEVSRGIRDNVLSKVASWLPESSILATVCLRPLDGPASSALKEPAQAARAVAQFRAVLDSLHQNLEGADSVFLAMDAPGSLAAALGSAVNATTQHPLVLLQLSEDHKRYDEVHVIRAQRVVARPDPSSDDLLKATRVLNEVRRVHGELVSWLRAPEQEPLVQHLGSRSYLRSEIDEEPAVTDTPLFRHHGGKWKFGWDLLLGLGALRARLETREDWNECLRLFLIHEAFHVRQGGLTSYNYRGIGWVGLVLEAADYDADAVGVEVALAWRKAQHGGAVTSVGELKTLESIIWNSLEMLRVFEPERPVLDLAERRLRRYLIWLFHVCRLSVLSVGAPDRNVREELGRVTVELVGLPSFRDPHETYAQRRVQLKLGDVREPVMFALYFRHRLVRLDNDRAWVEELLTTLRDWELPSREDLRERVRLLFEHFFDKFPDLLGVPGTGAR